MRVLGGFQHSLEQEGVLCDPLVGFGLHVPEPHSLALRVSLYPLNTGTTPQNQDIVLC